MTLKQTLDTIRNYPEPAELLLSHRYLREVNFQDNELKDIQCKEVSGKAVRVIHDGRVGAAPGGLQTPVDWLLSTASKLSRLGRSAAFRLPEGDGTLREMTYADPRVTDVDPIRGRELAETVIERLRADLPDWSVSGGVTLGRAVNRLVTSRGIDHLTEERGASFYIQVTLPREGDILDLFMGRSSFPDDTTLDEILNELVWRARQAETVTEMSPGKYPVLLHPMALASFLDAFEQALNGRAVYEGLSPLKDRLGETVFNPWISITDDPTDPTLSGYNPLGDEGTVASPVTLVDRGVLKSFLTDLDYSHRLNQPHTGHGSRFPGSLDESVPSGEASIDSSSWILAPGDTALNDMMSGIEDGIYLLASWDVWSGNLIGGDVSGSTHLAFRIKNGQPAGRIKDMRVSGNLYDLLGKQLLALSRERPQTSASALRAPFCLIDGVTLA